MILKIVKDHILVMKFKKNLKSIFLDPQLEYKTEDEKLNIILSPSLYWVKRISLPVKNTRDLLKLLPSIFEDILTDGVYSYYAYKLDDKFIVFAYNDKEIMNLLAEKGILLSNVANIYFSQTELFNEEMALKINDSEVLYKRDDILTLVPVDWIKEYKDLNLDLIKHTKHKVALHQFGHIVETKSLYSIGVILMVLILLLSSEYFITKYKQSEILDSKDEIFSKYHLKSTTFQNKALLKKYHSINKVQTNLRDYFSYILGFKLKDGEYIASMDIKNKKMVVKFNGLVDDRKTTLKSYLKSKNIPFNAKIFKDNIKIEVNL